MLRRPNAPLVAPQLVVHLPVSHVDAVHARRAALQEAVGEAARRQAGVERRHPIDIHPPVLQRRLQLQPAAAHEACRVGGEPQKSGGAHGRASFRERRAVHQQLALRYPRLQRRAAVLREGGQSQGVQPEASARRCWRKTV